MNCKTREKINQNVNSCYLMGENEVELLLSHLFCIFPHIFYADSILFYNAAIILLKCKEKTCACKDRVSFISQYKSVIPCNVP